MFEFHRDKARYFDYQYQTAREYVIPFIERVRPLVGPLRVLEIGCGEAGVLKAFLERGAQCVGIDLMPGRIELAKQFHAEALDQGRITFLTSDIYDIDVAKDLPHRFDVIVLKDVIEHIPQQVNFMRRLQDFLAPGGVVFFGFPPWQMPFGGHQQICQNRLLASLPYYHLLPGPVYRRLLQWGGETDNNIRELMDVKATGISIEAFESITQSSGLSILERQFFLFNPIYRYKFNLTPREQFAAIGQLPVVRNFLTTCAYYVVGNQSH